MAEDEPACEKLRTENEQITAYLMSCKEKQLDLLANIKALKEEKNKHIQRKVRISRNTPIVPMYPYTDEHPRKPSTSKWMPSLTTSVACVHASSNLQIE